MNKKIKQIIPAPEGLYANYEGDKEDIVKLPIVCLALVEDEDGSTRVEAMDITTGDAQIDFVDINDGFIGITK